MKELVCEYIDADARVNSRVTVCVWVKREGAQRPQRTRARIRMHFAPFFFLSRGALSLPPCPMPAFDTAAAPTPPIVASAAACSPPPASGDAPPTTIPIVDLAPLLAPSPSPAAVASTNAAVASALTATGCVVVRDPRVDERDNARFLDALQAYFAQTSAAKAADVRPELHYQVRRGCVGGGRNECV